MGAEKRMATRPILLRMGSAAECKYRRRRRQRVLKLSFRSVPSHCSVIEDTGRNRGSARVVLKKAELVKDQQWALSARKIPCSWHSQNKHI